MEESYLEWYVLQHNFNSNQIVRYNILWGWYDKIKEARRKRKFNNRKTFKEWLKKEFMYYYWAKCEREILVSGLFVKNPEKDVIKIDAWFQIEPNLDTICDYLIMKMKFRFRE